MKVGTIAEQVQKVEGFKIKILDEDVMRPLRADQVVDFDYDYKRAAPAKLTVSQWSRQRIPNGCVKVFKADGKEVHGRTTLNTVRQSYAV